MHAMSIIQDFLRDFCPSMHAKRRESLAKVTAAARAGGLGVVKMAKHLPSSSMRHRIKCCDRLLSNDHLHRERVMVYQALAHRLLQSRRQVVILVDWSELRENGSVHLLRAAAAVEGRAFTIYDEVHPQKLQANPRVHLAFMKTLKAILPAGCEPVIITDSGFRSTWFKALDKLGFSWIGRIRNRDMVRAASDDSWFGCKELYPRARADARKLGEFHYVRSNPTQCQLVIVKKRAAGRQSKNKFGQRSQSQRSNKARAVQTEPWLLAVSPRLNTLSAQQVVALYAARMQIEQTFRDLKNAQWGAGLRTSQTRSAQRLAILVLIAVLLTYALWIIGLTLLRTGYTVRYGSRARASSTLSVISLAHYWLSQSSNPEIVPHELKISVIELVSKVFTYEN